MCGGHATLIRSHIIPRSLWPRNDNGDRSVRVIKDDNSTPPYRIPDGIYDAQMVCRHCEDIFQPYDNYAAEILPHIRDSENPIRDSRGQVAAWVLQGVDCELLKFFVLSLLWRAHTTDRPEFRAVNLGPHAEIIAQALRQRLLPAQDIYQFMLFDIYHERYDKIHFTPIKDRVDGQTVYKFFCFNLAFVISVSKDRFREPLASFVPKSNKDFVVPRIKLEETHLLKSFNRLADKIRRHHAR